MKKKILPIIAVATVLVFSGCISSDYSSDTVLSTCLHLCSEDGYDMLGVISDMDGDIMDCICQNEAGQVTERIDMNDMENVKTLIWKTEYSGNCECTLWDMGTSYEDSNGVVKNYGYRCVELANCTLTTKALCRGDRKTCNEDHGNPQKSKSVRDWNTKCGEEFHEDYDIQKSMACYKSGFKCLELEYPDCPFTTPSNGTYHFYEDSEYPGGIADKYDGCYYEMAHWELTSQYVVKVINPCIESAIIINGTCQDAIEIYGGVCE